MDEACGAAGAARPADLTGLFVTSQDCRRSRFDAAPLVRTVDPVRRLAHPDVTGSLPLSMETLHAQGDRGAFPDLRNPLRFPSGRAGVSRGAAWGKEPRRSSRVPREPDRCRNPDPAVLVAALLDVMSVGAPELFGGALLRCAVVCERGARPQARECASRVTSLPDTFIARLAIGLQE